MLASYPSGKGAVCKTVIHQFESGRRLNAEVVKLVDTRDLKSLEHYMFVPVRFRPSVPNKVSNFFGDFVFFNCNLFIIKLNFYKMSKSNSPYIKFTYTLIGLKGEPQEKSYMLNLSYIVSIESLTNHEIKITMNNGKIVIIDLGINNKASIIMDDILDLSAVGSDYNVYNISSIDK